MSHLLIYDATLRDGNHAISHRLQADQIRVYASAADAAGVSMIEVGHGNGLGASSLQVGEALLSDETMLQVARQSIKRAKLAIHCMPGFATIHKNLRMALDLGVDVVRVASHCTEADITRKHIDFVRQQGKEVYGALMMSHMASKETLLEECLKMQSYGAQGVTLMDSAGALLPQEVQERIQYLVTHLEINVGFHAHNNLGLGVANSVQAIQAGARILDGTARGFGAGAGNAPLEVLVAVLEKMGYATGCDLYALLEAADLAEEKVMEKVPTIQSLSIISGLHGVFSGFVKHVERIAAQYGVDPAVVFSELGRREIVGGQEDIIIEICTHLREESVC